jgi:hypothetical protein
MPFEPNKSFKKTGGFVPNSSSGSYDDDDPSFKEKAGAAAYGAVTGLVGGVGELERFGVHTVPQFFGMEDPKNPETIFGRSGIFPSQAEVEQGLSKIGIKPPREQVSGYKTAGEILGGIGPNIPGMVRGAGRALLGVGTKTSEKLALAAEKLGFKLSPAQVRAEVPAAQKGATGFSEHNQNLANELASKGTGSKAKEITKEFISGRLKDVGEEFNTVYKGKQFSIDQDAVDAIRNIAAMEQALPGAVSVSPVRSVASEIINGFDSLAALPNAKPNTFTINGEALQRLRNSLTSKARSAGRGDAHEIYELVDTIDESIARNHPEVAAKLNEIRPKYRNSIILEDLYSRGGIQQGNLSLERLGTMLRGKRDAVRRSPSDIDNLAELGRELKLRAQWEPLTEGVGLSEILNKSKSALGTSFALRSRAARALQRKLAKSPPKSGIGYPGVSAAGTVVSPVNETEE